MQKKTCNFLTMSPPDKATQKLFIEFRNTDILMMLPVVIALIFVMWAGMLIQCIIETKVPQITNLVLQSIGLTLYLVVWALGKKYGKHISYMILTAYLIYTVINLIGT